MLPKKDACAREISIMRDQGNILSFVSTDVFDHCSPWAIIHESSPCTNISSWDLGSLFSEFPQSTKMDRVSVALLSTLLSTCILISMLSCLCFAYSFGPSIECSAADLGICPRGPPYCSILRQRLPLPCLRRSSRC